MAGIALALGLGALGVLAGCGDREGVEVEPTWIAGEVDVVPRPERVWRDAAGTSVALDAQTMLLVEPDDAAAREAANLLQDLLRRQRLALPEIASSANAGDAAARASSILLATAGADPELGAEGYALRAAGQRVEIRATSAAGLLHGVQTLRQLLPSAIESALPEAGVDWRIPAVRIEDRPRFAWRGYMLDVSRTFFPIEFVRRTVDLMALYKMSVLHLHLTDDQGWRIESDAFPQLHELGSRWDAERAPNERGGYYTKQELRDLVAYARGRHIEIVPEIDMPGHSLAMLHAMPELACTSSPEQVRTSAEFPIVPYESGPVIHEEILCAGRERVYEVLEAVLDEVLDLFPSRWVHIGGDEAPKAEWESSWECQALVRDLGLQDMEHLHAHFTRRIERFLEARGRVLIGWDEILEASNHGDQSTRLSDAAAVMHWRDFLQEPPAGLFDRDVVQTPFTSLYFDYLFVAPRKTYEFEPVPDGATPEQARHVLGVQGNMWTGFAPGRSEAGVDRHTFPKLLAVAETGWSAKERRSWDDFATRLPAHEERLDRLGVERAG